MNAPGWRHHPSAAQASPQTLDALKALAVSLLSDNMARASGAVGLTPFHRPKAMAGTAVTVRTRPGDNLAIHAAFDDCRPGDVLVIDGGGDLHQALMGDIMASYAESIGIAGLVIDGAIRDVAALRARDFPVYAKGVTHRGPYKNGPGEINVPVTVGGMVVHPGDIVVGDEDGVLAIPQADATDVIERARAQEQKEAQALRSIAAGAFDRSWVTAQLERAMKG
ncbi:RraA family protein [Caballeronia concitans]|uniref:Putative 4-hydroxy-4-methyl-2-oxoglutarate aldolase n=1 Tax=Caballeronia concitans TaxID=1777133 RepID=A0A658QXD7_9BURK|nr:RraA family protein [Caballeronia concitans]KIG03101.1 Dimethylmenaquinone methyltransferase [Burkholderia sp. MR1]SAL30966.1 diguanylate cyclase [Caballeronia concitans]